MDSRVSRHHAVIPVSVAKQHVMQLISKWFIDPENYKRMIWSRLSHYWKDKFNNEMFWAKPQLQFVALFFFNILRLKLESQSRFLTVYWNTYTSPLEVKKNPTAKIEYNCNGVITEAREQMPLSASAVLVTRWKSPGSLSWVICNGASWNNQLFSSQHHLRRKWLLQNSSYLG